MFFRHSKFDAVHIIPRLLSAATVTQHCRLAAFVVHGAACPNLKLTDGCNLPCWVVVSYKSAWLRPWSSAVRVFPCAHRARGAASRVCFLLSLSVALHNSLFVDVCAFFWHDPFECFFTCPGIHAAGDNSAHQRYKKPGLLAGKRICLSEALRL